MLIVFNALQTSLNGGIGRYSFELAKQLYYCKDLELKLVVREQDLDLFKFANINDLIVIKGIRNAKIRNLYEQIILPHYVSKNYPNAIIHYPDTMAPLFSKNKVIITVHDLAFKSLKNIFKWQTVLWKTFITDLSIKKAKKIIAITNFTKDEIYRHYPNIDKSKVEVIYNGFNDFSNEEIDNSNIQNNIKNIDYPYILTVSTISPRKNIDNLIKAYNLIKDKTEEKLIIAGADGWMCEDIHKMVKKLNLADKVVFTGKINDDELKYLYKMANKFVYISLYEGFGLPPLEAMSYGLPCIVSNCTSLPEVVGENAIKVNPTDVLDISNRILNLNIEKRKYNEHLKNFSWEKCAEQVVTIYRKENQL